MKHVIALMLLVLLVAPLQAGIYYEVTDAGTNGSGDPITRFNYIFSDIDLLANQEIEIRFDPAIFASIFNAVGSTPTIDVLYLQVNNAPGAAGTYSIVALQNHPALTGPFSIDAVLAGAAPTSMPYRINQLDSAGGPGVVPLSAGSAYNTAATPEPSTAGCICILLAGAIGWRRLSVGAKRIDTRDYTDGRVE